MHGNVSDGVVRKDFVAKQETAKLKLEKEGLGAASKRFLTQEQSRYSFTADENVVYLEQGLDGDWEDPEGPESCKELRKKVIKLGGVLSMIFATLMFTAFHDLVTIISSFFGLFAVVGIIKEVYSSAMQKYKISGMICLLLLWMNNYVYYTTQFIEWLPLIQKITFLIVLLWIIGLNYELRKKIKKKKILNILTIKKNG